VTATRALWRLVYRQVMVASPARFTSLWWFKLCVGIQGEGRGSRTKTLIQIAEQVVGALARERGAMVVVVGDDAARQREVVQLTPPQVRNELRPGKLQGDHARRENQRPKHGPDSQRQTEAACGPGL